MGSDRLRVGIIGAGVMGSHYAKVIREYARAELAAVCDTDLARAEALAGDDAPAFGSADAMLADAALDAVVVATPDFAHREPVMACLEAGKAVLCEKPLATTQDDCEAIVEGVRRTGRPFMVNFGNRHRAAALRVREALEAGRIGKPQSVYIRLNERLAKTLTIGWLGRTTPVWFLMSHCVDLVTWLLDDRIRSVYARASRGVVAETAPGVPDLCVCLATTATGCHVVLETAWHLPEGFAPNIDFMLQVIGESGVIQSDLFPHDLNLYAERAESLDHSFGVTSARGHGVGWWQESVRYFAGGVLDGKPLRPTAEEGAVVTSVLLAVERSAETGSVVAVDR
jgi:predicted dehydrogenase